jgi:Ribosomal protein L4/L1 family
VTIVDSFAVGSAKTRDLLATLASLGADAGAVVVLGERSDAVFRAARNLERVHVVTPNGLNLLDVLRLPRLVLTESAVRILTRTLTGDATIGSGAVETPAPVEAVAAVEPEPEPTRPRRRAPKAETTEEPDAK